MAIYRLHAEFVAGSKGHSSTAASAYRSGEKVRHEELVYRTKAKHQESMDKGEISTRFRKQLADKGIELTGNARVEKLENRWEVVSGKQRFTVRQEMTGRNEDKPQLSIYSHRFHDYSRRKGVSHTEIMTPDDFPDWLKDRSELWNSHRATEKRGDAQQAHEVQKALPRELSLEQNIGAVRGFVKEHFISQGMIADISIHNDPENHNPHAHILLTIRDFDGNGFGNVNREWNDGRDGMRKQQLNHWRKEWSEHANRCLSDAGFSAKIDHRTLKAQGIDREPTVHMGKEATAMEKRGEETRRGLKTA